MNQNNKQTLQENAVYNTGIKRPLMATANTVHELFVVIYLHQLRHLYVFGKTQCY